MSSNRSGADPNSQSPLEQDAMLASLWSQFNALFPTSESCLLEICRRIIEEGCTDCRSCGAPNCQVIDMRRLRCRKCHRKTSVTAGTFFNRIRRPKAWLAAIWLMERGVTLNSAEFQRLACVAVASAQHIHKKTTTVIQSHMGPESKILPSALFSVIFCKRSRETPARAHPVAEEDGVSATDAADPVTEQPEETPEIDPFANDLSETERQIFVQLNDTPIGVDALLERTGLPCADTAAALTMLEIGGLVVRLPGNRFVARGPVSVKSSPFDDLQDTVKSHAVGAISFVRSMFHGISRKYLQHYLASYWCHLDRIRWDRGALMSACVRFGRITGREIVQLVCPPLVKLQLPASRS